MKLIYLRLFKGVTCAHWPCKRCDTAGRTSWKSREAWHHSRPIGRVFAALQRRTVA